MRPSVLIIYVLHKCHSFGIMRLMSHLTSSKVRRHKADWLYVDQSAGSKKVLLLEAWRNTRTHLEMFRSLNGHRARSQAPWPLF